MKKFIRFYFLFSLITLVFSCADDNVESKNIEMDFQLQIDIADNMIDLYDELLLQNTPEQSRALLVENLMEIADIRDAGISEDGTTVCWEYKDGLEYCYFTETSLTLDIAGRRANNANRESSSVFNDPRIVSENKNALILSPYQYEWAFFDFIDESNELASMLATNDYNVNFKLNEENSLGGISLEDYQQFNDYSVIALSTHGGVTLNGDVGINSGVLFTEEMKSAMKDDIDKKLVGIGSSRHLFPWARRDVVLLTARWFDLEYDTKLNQTLVHISACKSLQNQTLSNALIGNESAFLGWTDNVSAVTSAENAINFFDYLLDGQTVREAYDQLVIDGTTTSNQADFMKSSNTYNNLALKPEILLEGNMDFGSVVINSNREELLTITNLTDAEMSINEINTPNGYSATLPDDFFLNVIEPQGSLNATIIFQPTEVTEYPGTLEVVYNTDQVNNTIAVSGNGVSASGRVVISPSSLNFGNTQINAQSNLKYITVSNGTSSSIAIIVDCSGPFGSDGQGTIGPNSSRSFAVYFSPSASGVQSGSANVYNDVTDQLYGSVNLSGTGIE